MKPGERINQLVEEDITRLWKAMENPQIPREKIEVPLKKDPMVYFRAIVSYLDERAETKKAK